MDHQGLGAGAALAFRPVGRNDAPPRWSTGPESLMRFGFFACLLAVFAVSPAFAQKQVNVYNWSDYIAEEQLKTFAQQTGIKVNYTTYDSNEILDAKLRAGRSG
jgi:spermidine/putrescine-binding protein